MGIGLKLFGVTILRQGKGEGEGEEEGMRKSSSMGNLATCMAPKRTTGDHGYLSDGLLQSSKSERSRLRKKGVPWTQEEHKTFLAGLKTLGKGDWRGISRKFVKTKTPTQVASHAQKYFLRQTTPSSKKRRSSLFDFEMNDTAETSKIAPTLSMEKISNTSEEINLLQHRNYLISIGNKRQAEAAAQSSEAFPTLSSTCGQVSNFHGLSYREEISSDETNQPFVRRSDVLQTLNLCSWADRIPRRIHDYAPCAPDLLQPSINLLPHTPPPSLPRWINQQFGAHHCSPSAS